MVVFYGCTLQIEAEYWRRTSCKWAEHLECSTYTHNMLFKLKKKKEKEKSTVSVFTNMKTWY